MSDSRDDDYGADDVRVVRRQAGGSDAAPTSSGPPSAVRRFPSSADEQWAAENASAELPHWTEPPTGEIPRIRPEDPVPSSADDDYGSWAGISSAPRFRTDAGDWAEADFGEGELVHDDATAVGALNETDWQDETASPPSTPPRSRSSSRGRGSRGSSRGAAAAGTAAGAGAGTGGGGGRGGNGGRGSGGAGGRGVAPGPRRTPPTSDGATVVTRVVTALAVAAVAVLCWAVGRGALLFLAVVIVGVAAVELSEAYRRAGYHVATALALFGSVALVLAAYDRGERAYPMVSALVVGFTFFWYLFEVVRARPTVNIALTLLVFSYVGLFGGFAGLLLAPDPGGPGFLMGVVLCAVAYDVMGWLVGSQFGRTRLLERVSPNKTTEGLIAGCIAAVVVGGVVGGVLHPWADKGVGAGLALGALVAILAPLGDLCESMIKRDLGVKDLGTLLPGHGGVIDRFDAILFCLPAAYYLALALF